MTKLNKSVIPAFVLLFSSAVLASGFVYARAESITPVIDETKKDRQEEARFKREEVKENIMEKKEETREKLQERACVLRANRINNRIKMMGATERFHVTRYEFFVTRLENLLERLDGKGYDTSAVETDLTELNKMTAELKQMWEDLMQKLSDMKELDCTSLEAPQSNLTQELKTDLAAIKEKAEELRTYILETVKVDLKALQDEVKADITENETDEISEETEE